MSADANDHDQGHVDRVYLYALHALPAAELAGVEAQIAACEACRREADALRPIVATFADWPTDVLRPSPSLWDRVSARIAADAGTTPLPNAHAAWPVEDWREVAPGIAVRILSTDAETDGVSMLVRLAPRTAYPPHRHAGVEELHLLEGELWIDDRLLRPGDYNRGEPGAVDELVYSETGCTCVLITSLRDAII